MIEHIEFVAESGVVIRCDNGLDIGVGPYWADFSDAERDRMREERATRPAGSLAPLTVQRLVFTVTWPVENGSVLLAGGRIPVADLPALLETVAAIPRRDAVAMTLTTIDRKPRRLPYALAIPDPVGAPVTGVTFRSFPPSFLLAYANGLSLSVIPHEPYNRPLDPIRLHDRIMLPASQLAPVRVNAVEISVRTPGHGAGEFVPEPYRTDDPVEQDPTVIAADDLVATMRNVAATVRTPDVLEE